MTFANIIDTISENYSIELPSRGIDCEIRDVAFIDSKHNTTLKNTLYFGYDRQLENKEFLPYQCVIARTEPAALFLPNEGNVALVSEDLLFTIFNDVKALIETTRSKGIFVELTALADRSHSLEAVIDAASVKLGNSLIFCDMNFKIIASSSIISVLDPLWIENTKQGYCSYEFMSEVKNLKSVQNASQTPAAFEVTCPRSPFRKLSSKVFHKQTQIGFLLMIEGENTILPSHFEMLSSISHVISYTIAYYTPELFEKNSLYQELLYDILIGAPSEKIMPRLKEFYFPPKMLVLFIRPTRYLGQHHLINITYKNLKIRIPDTLATFHKKGIVAVVPLREENSETVAALIEICKDFCQQEHLRIGISNSFGNIENLANYYEQAQAALELGQKLKPEELVCQYQNYQIFVLFSETREPDKLGRFCHPALATLRQYDHKNNSELYKTLCVYIDKGCNIKLTSESLFIHRNSLVYRLNRIIELCHIDFSDVNTIFLLRLSFLIDRYYELNTNTEWK